MLDINVVRKDSASVLSFSTHSTTASHGFIAASPVMNRVRELARRAAASDVPVVVIGEANTGKEFIARLIHADSDRRSDGLVAIDASFDADRVEASISATATRGTLLVAEMTALSLALQLKVLRSAAPPTGGPHVRLLATTSLDRERRRHDRPQVASTFRRRLYRQHGAFIIEVPSLRDRRADIVPLARHFLAQARPNATMTMDTAVERELEAYDWPDNLAELRGVITRVALATKGTVVKTEALRGLGRHGSTTLATELAAMPYREMLEEMRRRAAQEYFSLLLRETGGNVTHTAARAGIGRESLYRILKHLGLSASDFRRRK